MTTQKRKSSKKHPELSLSVLFCDDIRQEIGGKVTIVGAYQSKMLVSHFPTVQPRLGVFMFATAPGKKVQPFIFNVFKDDELLESMTIDADLQLTNDMQVALVLGPISFEAKCLLRTEMVAGNETLQGRSLEVLTFEEFTATQG